MEIKGNKIKRNEKIIILCVLGGGETTHNSMTVTADFIGNRYRILHAQKMFCVDFNRTQAYGNLHVKLKVDVSPIPPNQFFVGKFCFHCIVCDSHVSIRHSLSNQSSTMFEKLDWTKRFELFVCNVKETLFQTTIVACQNATFQKVIHRWLS